MSKAQNLEQIFEQASHDQKKLFELLQIGRNKGFGNFINRKQVWPFLLDLDVNKIKQTPVFQWKGGMNRNSNDFDQLQKDAERSLSSMKTFDEITKFHLKKKQEAVLSVLDTFFAKNKDLRYIQGFHDVASIFLILFGNSMGYYLIQKSGRSYFYDFLCFQFGEVGKNVSKIVYNIVTEVDPSFKQIFSSYHISQFLIFLIPWILTWFSHNFTSVKVICRIWDYLLCTGPYGIFYLASAIIISTKAELLDSCEELDDPNIQTFYQEQARKDSIDIEKAIKTAISLQSRVNIQKTEGFSQLHVDSMFRYQNFQHKIKVHKQYFEAKKRAEKRKQNIYKGVKIGAVVALTLLTVVAVKSQKVKSILGQL